MNRTTLSVLVAFALIFSAINFVGGGTPIAKAAACTGTYAYTLTDLSDFWCPVTDLNRAYSGVPDCPATDPTGASCTGPCKINSYWGGLTTSCVISTDYYSCLDATGVAITSSCTAPVTAALVANPTSILSGEQSLITWSSVGATTCTGDGFSTGGAVSGSILVSPAITTAFAVTCTGASGTATANAAVTVIDGSFQLSCQGHPLNAAIGEDVLWSSTVTGPQGTYVYGWGGTEALTGSGTQVFKRYATQGAKTAQLTVEFIPTPGPMALFTKVTDMLAAVAAAGNGAWVMSGPTTNYACVDNWQTAMAADNTFNGTICGPSPTCTAAEIGTTCYSMTNTPPSCALGGTGDHSIHITPYTCTAVTPAPASQCPAGQTPVQVINYDGGSCVGGTVVGRDGDILDGAQIGMWPADWMLNTCVNAGAQEGDCCEYSQKASQNFGGGFPPNSYWRIRVVRGGSSGAGPSDFVQPVGLCSGRTNQYDCSSVAGTIGTKCVAGVTPPPGKTGKIIKTVQCDNAVTIGAPQCSDGIDNNGDGLTDAQDPGCLVGAGGAGGGTYNPNDNTEGSGALNTGASQCSDGIDNNGDGLIDFPEDPGCSSADDNLEVAEAADISLTVNPPLIKKDQQCTITLSARNVASCSLSGQGISKLFTAISGIVTTKEVVTPGLAQTATYTLTCKGVDGKTATKKVDCKIAPTFEEI